MSRIVVELTNRCNLDCHHCFEGRNSADGDIKIEVIEKVLRNARSHGFNYLGLTGGEPTLHNSFMEIIKIVYEAGYKFGFVSNGWNFTGIYEKLLPYKDKLGVITFSLDGAREETHDRMRGKGSYRRMMQAVSICVVKDIPFTINNLITSYNREELREMVELATKLGSQGLRFGNLMPTPLNTAEEMNLSPEERREAEATVWQLQKSFQIPVFMATGFYTDELFPCAPLKMQEFNIDWRGNLTMCCSLSGHGDNQGNGDVTGNLNEMSFSEAYERLVRLNKKFRKHKLERHSNGRLSDSDYFPCWYCLNYFNKIDWLKESPGNARSRLPARIGTGR